MNNLERYPEVMNLSHQQAPDDLLSLDCTVNNIGVKALIDSGAGASFIDASWVHKNGLTITPIPRISQRVWMADGTINIGKGTVNVPLTIGAWTCEVNCIVLPALTRPIILGMPWIKQHDPVIKWSTGDISINDI
jgi:hypothetical protein